VFLPTLAHLLECGKGLFISPGYHQKWIYGDFMRNGNMAAKARHTIRSPSQALLGLKSSLFSQGFAQNTIEQ